MTDGPIDDTVDTGCDSANAVFAADATESGSSGTGVVDAGVMTDGPIDDTVDTGCDSANAVFAADATESGSSGTGVVYAGVMTDGPIDDTIDTGCDSTNAVFAADATESGSCDVGGAASCVPGNDNSVGGSAIDSICKGTDGTHEVLTDGISDDCDYANDSGFIDDHLCNSIADTNDDGLGATTVNGYVGDRGVSSDIRGGGGTNATVSASTFGECDAKKVAVIKPFPQTYQILEILILKMEVFAEILPHNFHLNFTFLCLFSQELQGQVIRRGEYVGIIRKNFEA
ncbi:unnamed protein product [Porites lobata]|uniref:Uncharacterized protein n=1 Tax=Porites lobata TaxID=104759 RepID=A0ABN8PUW1_9CNID|nr:unnamed protein product [Porites lobata]